MKIPNLVALTCLEVTELMTDYMAAELEPADRVQFEQHLYACTWCMTYLTQLRRSVEWTRALQPVEREASAPSREALAAILQRWKNDGSSR